MKKLLDPCFAVPTPGRTVCSLAYTGAFAAALAGLFLLTLARFLVAALVPLSADEAYYRVWSRALAGGYLDHPPMVAVFIRAGTALLGESALGVRFLAPLGAAAGTLLLADAARRLFPGTGAALRAAVLLNATLMIGAGAVTMTPDTPLLLFWCICLHALARVASGGSGWWWPVAGLAAGLGFDSKYTAALLAPAAALLLCAPPMRRWWRSPLPWAGAVLAILATVPVLWWNAGHGWASLLKQGGRTGDWNPTPRFLAELVGGQVGLATPGVFLLFCLGVGVAARRWRDPGAMLAAGLVLPGAAVFLQHAVGDRVQANWVAILYPGCALAAGACAVRWWRPAAGLGFALTAAVYVQAAPAPLPLPRALDPTLRLAGWEELAAGAEATAKANGLGFLASEDYGAASLLAWWARALPVRGAEGRWRFVDLPGGAAPSGDGLLLVSARRREEPDPAYWSRAEPLGEVARGRGGVEAERYRLYRVAPRFGVPLPQLPGRVRD